MQPNIGSGFTRRAFLGASAGGLLVSQVKAQQPAAGAEPLRIAQVGTGARGSHWALDIEQHYRNEAAIVGLCDINLKRAQAMQQAMASHPPAYADFDRMIREVNPDRC